MDWTKNKQAADKWWFETGYYQFLAKQHIEKNDTKKATPQKRHD
ncbi:hypothetical protein ACWOAH_09835 [Vagococcus vulneris]|nr:hypothetical protein [Vagococcus vulneris]